VRIETDKMALKLVSMNEKYCWHDIHSIKFDSMNAIVISKITVG